MFVVVDDTATPEEDPVHFISVDTAWQLRNDRRDRFMADAARRRRLPPAAARGSPPRSRRAGSRRLSGGDAGT